MINRFLSFLEGVSDDIRVGNALISIEPILSAIKQDIEQRKTRLIHETPEKFTQMQSECLARL
jgi:hypothetical protein